MASACLSLKTGGAKCAEATLAVVAIGWAANTAGLNLDRAGVEDDTRDFVRVDDYQRTSAPHVFAAGDVTGRMMLVPQAIQEGLRRCDQCGTRRDDDGDRRRSAYW